MQLHIVRRRIPSALEIRRLLLFLLGRQPSDSAIAELSQRPLGVSADLILLGAEFEASARRGLIDSGQIPHHRQPFTATGPELRWIAELVCLSSESSDALQRVRDWLGLLAVLLRDPSLEVRMRSEWQHHQRLPNFLAFSTEVANRYTSAATAADLALTRPSAPARRPVEASVSRPVRRKPEILGAKPKDPTTERGDFQLPQPAAEEDQPVRVAGITGPALDREAAEALWRRVLADPASPKLRGELYNAFRQNEKLLLYLNARVDEVPRGRCSPYESLIRMLAARVYLRMFMARSARVNGQAALAADDAAPGALRDSDRNRLFKTLATAALRTGQVGEAIEILVGLLRQDPLDWEAYIGLADTIGGTDSARASELYATALHLNPGLGSGARLSVAEFHYTNGNRVEARRIVLDMLRAQTSSAECHLALANMALSERDRATWLARMNSYFLLHGITTPAFQTADPTTHLFGIGPSVLQRRDDHPMVSIVTTAWNAAATIASSMRSVLGQSRGNFELLIVDDCSEDATVEIVRDFEQQDPRVRLLRNTTNIGTYCSKNRAITEARGAFVTLHDSDDWMHPQRIERHLEAMAVGEPAASMSNWVRMDIEGHAVLRKGGGYLHRNPASTFIRRDVFDRVGLFDSVRVGADSEMLWRMRHALGLNSIAEIEACLGLGLHHENSLTQSGVTAFDEFRFSPVRLDYAEAWGSWHIRQLNSGRPLHIGFPLLDRGFDAPEHIVVRDRPTEAINAA